MTPEEYANHRLDRDFARLEALYESGAIDAEQLASRRTALKEQQELMNREGRKEEIRRGAESDPFPVTSKTDCKSRDAQHR